MVATMIDAKLCRDFRIVSTDGEPEIPQNALRGTQQFLWNILVPGP